MYFFSRDCITTILYHSSIMSWSNAKKRSCESNYVTYGWYGKKWKTTPSTYDWNDPKWEESPPYNHWSGFDQHPYGPRGLSGTYYKHWINWTKDNETHLSAMKSKGKKHWRKVVEDDDEFLSQMMEKIQDDYLRNNILGYCPFIHVENLYKHVLKELTETFPKLIKHSGWGVFDYKDRRKFWWK